MNAQEGVAMQPASDVRPTEFSLMLGGPLFQLYRRTHLSGDALELLRRRVVVITLFAWLPLLLLSVFAGHAVGGDIKIPFLHDVEANARFLVALPALIIAELVVHKRISPLAQRFLDRRIVVGEDVPALQAAVKSAMRVRNSVAVELTLLVFVYTVGLWIWRSEIALGSATWYAHPDSKHVNLTPAGFWYVFASIPLFQFILLRWYMRLALWFRLLWKISRLNLHLSAAHPDQAGGIGFLGKSSYAFAPILFAEGATLAGLIANRVLYDGRTLLSFKMEAVGLVLFFVLLIIGPLVMFTPKLDDAQRQGSREYGLLANRYVFGFEDKWIRHGFPEAHEVLGTADLQSLADLGNSYAMVRQMRIFPFVFQDITRLAAATILPFVPLSLTVFSLADVLKFLVKMIFH